MANFKEFRAAYLEQSKWLVGSSFASLVIAWFQFFGGSVPPYIAGAIFILSIAVCLYRMWASEHKKVTALEARGTPRLTLHCDGRDGCMQRREDPTTGESVFVYRIVVDSASDVDIEECRGILKRVEKDGVKMWSGDDLILTFQPAENPDSTSKTIRPGGSANLDVMFVRWKNGNVIRVHAAHQAGDEHTFPQNKEPEVFPKFGQYFLYGFVEAKGMKPIPWKVGFFYQGDSSFMGSA